MNWTDEQVDLLKRLWGEGISASQIGDRIGCSRNAVIGKVTRMRLASRKTTRRLDGFAARPKRAAKRPRLTPMIKHNPVAELFAADAYVPPAEEIFIPAEERKSLLQLDDTDCRWPIGDPLKPDFHFCNRQKMLSLPYCEVHSRRAFQPVPVKKKSDIVVPLPVKRKTEEVGA